MSAYDYMRPKDVDVFRAAALRYQVWILVRASNKAAKDYIGSPGYTPKRLDCKAKTAECNAIIPGTDREKLTSGLVINPTLKGMETAFDSIEKYNRALEFWHKFEIRCHIPKPGEPKVTYFPGGKLYSVQVDPTDVHYGCVLFSSWSGAANASYIHSDYDLFGLVLRDDPIANVRVSETRLGEAHSRGRELFDIQHFLNKRMGVAMILHGEQEKYSDDVNDRLDVFWPDGVTVTEAYGAEAIRSLYESTFQGRRLYGPDAKSRPFFGKWQAL